MRLRSARTGIEREASERARALRRQTTSAIHSARQDAGLSLRALARASGVSASTLAALERGQRDPTTEVLTRLGTALGMQLSIRFYPGTGPIIRDHIQAAMIGALSDVLHERWQPTPEVRVHQPVRGVIDLVLEAPEPPLVSCEGHSQLRRLEQQVRWASAKSEALAQARGRPVSRLLLLHSSRRMRAVVAEYVSFLRAAFPASTASAYAALAGESAWPGDAILWCDIRGSSATVLHHPPRGVALGR